MADPQLDAFVRMLQTCRRVVGFTGAGISTESGIPDYRSQGGIWNKYQPVYIDEFLQSRQKRILYWRRKAEFWPGIRDADPNSGHSFFKKLYEKGILHGVITQNIDGLHEKSGLPAEIIVNLHGSSLTTSCLSCGTTVSTQDVYENLDLDNTEPLCGECGRAMKPDTISFGQSLKPQELSRASAFAQECDLLIVVGSTLIVYPAAGIPEEAKRNKASTVLITLSETALDGLFDLVFHEKIGAFMERLQKKDNI
jgi:NAD-dependent deacetylase